MKRESVISDGGLLVDDERVLVHGVDVGDADVAIIVDSGFMWPIPVLDPSPEQWISHRTRFDDYLRDERESASLWFSFLDIINVCVPLCINPQPAFALEAMKPDAFGLLRSAGIAVPPMITTNRPEALTQFAVDNSGELLELSLCNAPARWLEGGELGKQALEEAPVMVQAVESREVTRVMVVGAETVAAEGTHRVPQKTLTEIQGVLGAEWTQLVFRRVANGWGLSDFSAAPSFKGFEAAAIERVLGRLWALVQARLGER